MKVLETVQAKTTLKILFYAKLCARLYEIIEVFIGSIQLLTSL